MSLRSIRRNVEPTPVVDAMLDSIVNAATGGAHRSSTQKSADMQRSRAGSRSSAAGTETKKKEDDTLEDVEFNFPSPGPPTPEEEEEWEGEDTPLTPIHESVDLLEAMTGDRSKPPMRFCPADPPAGSKPYDPGALSKHQQRRLNHLKRGVARDDQRYLSQHPEIGAVCALLLSAILREQPLDVRDFCSKWVKRDEMRQDVDNFLLRCPPPSRHDDMAEIHDWFPEADLTMEEDVLIAKPAEDALRKIERAQRRSRVYDHRATLLHSDLIREGAEDMVRRWLDDMLTTALSHRTEYWEHFEEAQGLVTDELDEKKKKLTTEEEEEREAEIAEAEKAVADALKSLHKRVEIVDTQKKAGVFIMEAPGEEFVEPVQPVDARREESERVEAVAEALQKLRTVSRGGPSYMAALSEAITRLQEHRAGELEEKPTSMSERALRWSAIVRGERASMMMSKQEMDEKALRLAAAVAKTERKKSMDQAALPPGAEGEFDEDDEEQKRQKRKEGAAKKRKMISKKDLEQYNLRLSLVFPELADMLHDEGDEEKVVKDLPFQEQMAAATMEALELATKRFKKKPGKRSPGRRELGPRPGAEYESVDMSIGGERTPEDAKAYLRRRRQKRLPTAVVFEGLDPGQMKEKLRQEAEAQLATYQEEEESEDISEMGQTEDSKTSGKKKSSIAPEEGRATTQEGSKEEEGEQEEPEDEEAGETDAGDSVTEEGDEFEKVAAEDVKQERVSKGATEKLRTMSQSAKKTSTTSEGEELEGEKPVEAPTEEETEKEPPEESPAEQPRKSSVSTKPLTPDPPTPGDDSE